MSDSRFSIVPDKVKAYSTEISECSTSLENSSTQIEDVKDGLSPSLIVVAPVLAAISARSRAHAAKVTALGAGLDAVTQQYVNHQNNIVAKIQQGNAFVPLSAKGAGNPEGGGQKSNNPFSNISDRDLESLRERYNLTPEEMEYLLLNNPGLVSALYATDRYSHNDAKKVMEQIRDALNGRISYGYSYGGYDFPEEYLEMLKDLEMGSYGLDYLGYGVYDEDGNLIGIMPHSVEDGGITLGYGHYISEDEYNTDPSERALIDAYIDNPDFNLPAGAIPGADYVPIDVVNSLYMEDVAKNVAPVVDFLKENNIQLSTNQVWALVMYRYCRGSLSQTCMDMLKAGVTDEAAWREIWVGAENRQEACQELFFGK